MTVAGDQLIGSEIVQELFEQRKVLPGLSIIGPRFVVVARQQQRDRYVPHGVVDDGPIGNASLFARGAGSGAPWPERRWSNALLSQVIVDAERDTALEAGRGENVARMTGICEPLHDRPQALCDASGRVADAVVID